MVKMNNILEDVNNINEDLNFQLIEQGKDIDEINKAMVATNGTDNNDINDVVLDSEKNFVFVGKKNYIWRGGFVVGKEDETCNHTSIINITELPDDWTLVGSQLEKGEPATIDVDNISDWCTFYCIQSSIK